MVVLASRTKLRPETARKIRGYGKSTPYSLGVEEEFQLLDAETFELKPVADRILTNLGAQTSTQIKHELMNSVIETSTIVCEGTDQAYEDLKRLRSTVIAAAKEEGALVASSGTTPVSQWEGQQVTDQQRYRDIVSKLQWVARRELIFGLHVHVGVDSADKCLYVFNELRRELPELLALSANSPFWQGAATGLQSSRIKIFDSFPRGGMPEALYGGWDEFEQLLERGAVTGLVPDHTYIWWDLRPHPDFGTIEIRICDAQSRLDDTMAISALIQAMVAYHGDRFDQGEALRADVPTLFIEENRWSAARYGLDGEMLDFNRNEMVATRTHIARLLDRVEPAANRLGSARWFDHLSSMLVTTGASRTLDAWNKGQRSGRAAGAQIVRDTASF